MFNQRTRPDQRIHHCRKSGRRGAMALGDRANACQLKSSRHCAALSMTAPLLDSPQSRKLSLLCRIRIECSRSQKIFRGAQGSSLGAEKPRPVRNEMRHDISSCFASCRLTNRSMRKTWGATRHLAFLHADRHRLHGFVQLVLPPSADRVLEYLMQPSRI